MSSARARTHARAHTHTHTETHTHGETEAETEAERQTEDIILFNVDSDTDFIMFCFLRQGFSV